MYTFASPRIGDMKFAEIFNSKLSNHSERIYIEGDVVPEIPFTTNGPESYKHVDVELQLTNEDLDFPTVWSKHKIRNIINTITAYPKNRYEYS